MTILAADLSNLQEWVKYQSLIQHQNNVKWWYNIHTGERLNRNKAEMIALMHSELSEAWKGLYRQDDKLPQYNGGLVEIVDTFIRLFDFIGGFNIPVNIIAATEPMVSEMQALSITHLHELTSYIYTVLLRCHGHLSEMLEYYRKSKGDLNYYVSLLVTELILLFAAVKYLEDKGSVITIDEILQAKADFNKVRADHQVENRKADGGKKF